ncbi:CsbD family protein [Sphingomonas sp. PAMC 26605]|uniref:CsbD family protein n=1 Tax=Sphingomonas sp. PAMC 26605 TaxID=1112214 RepID=UPI00026CABE1|nr:CsbD family protein [Sphingomonas sp. PAMC 26605]
MTQHTDKGRARQAKGSVKEAIGKIIGDVDVERQGRRESKAGAEQARGESPATKDRGN